jgi:hypothetical protein
MVSGKRAPGPKEDLVGMMGMVEESDQDLVVVVEHLAVVETPDTMEGAMANLAAQEI